MASHCYPYRPLYFLSHLSPLHSLYALSHLSQKPVVHHLLASTWKIQHNDVLDRPKAESTCTTHTANAPLKRRRVGLRASVSLAVVIWGFERRRRKKAVSRALCWWRVYLTRHPSVTVLMVEFHFKDFGAYFGFVNGVVAFSGMGCTDRGFGKAKGEEGSRWKPLSAARVAHAPPLLPRSDGRSLFLTDLDIGGWKRQRRRSYLNVMGDESLLKTINYVISNDIVIPFSL
ncbi:hypothetical protein Cgig2_020665 [Carnegiea gigantea]|uniref:Uncharacterized protein n=1 Tax=Carnegiea gigantea TaxID=171969 RepID=A0A9Q1QIA1_9CARY|nr:hypothetical protein Cgig2_020665 [Carnegiea gigantea]